MTNREFFVQRMQAELPAFRKVLQALPPDRLDYKPHESSPTAQQIVWTLAREWEVSLNVVHENKGEWTNLPAPAMNEMVPRFEKAWNGVAEGAAKLDDAAWDKNAQFYYGGKMVSEQPVNQFLWFILFDAIHHRGQLTTYIRPMGGKVPAVYGPSGDERPRV
jgi:uncharacterized damage-inducible protein DinB